VQKKNNKPRHSWGVMFKWGDTASFKSLTRKITGYAVGKGRKKGKKGDHDLATVTVIRRGIASRGTEERLKTETRGAKESPVSSGRVFGWGNSKETSGLRSMQQAEGGWKKKRSPERTTRRKNRGSGKN